MSRARVWGSALCLWLGLCAPARASEHPWLSIALRAPDRSRIEAAALQLDAARRSALSDGGYGCADLLRRHELHLQRNGDLESIDVRALYFVTAQGVRDRGNLETTVSSELEQLVIEEAWVLEPDGRRRAIDTSVLQVTDGSTDGLFSDEKRVVLPFDGLQPGSIAVLVTRTTTRTAHFPLPWARSYYAESSAPVERFELELHWTAGKPAPHWRTDDPKLECDEQRGLLRCARTGIPAVPYDPDVRSWPDQVSHIVISAAESWAALAAVERKLMDKSASTNAAVRAQARKLVADSESPHQGLERIHRYVADEVRYVGLEHGESSVVPHPAAMTLQRGFGDCKDKVALFVALARAAGLDAFGALVASGRYDSSRLLAPAWTYFDHMIACVREGDERPPTCIDLTVPELPTGLLPLGLHGALALPLDGVAEAPLHLPAPRFGLQVELYSYNELNCDGSITERLTRQLGGPAAWEARVSLHGLDAVGRERAVRERYEQVMGDKVKPTFEIEEHGEAPSVLVVKSVATYPGSKPARELTELSENDSWLADYALSNRSLNKHHPLYLYGMKVTSAVYYHVCGETRVTFPGASLSFTSPFGRLTRTYTTQDRHAEVQTVLEIPSGELDASVLPRFHAFLDSALDQALIHVDLQPKKAP